MKSTFSR